MTMHFGTSCFLDALILNCHHILQSLVIFGHHLKSAKTTTSHTPIQLLHASFLLLSILGCTHMSNSLQYAARKSLVHCPECPLYITDIHPDLTSSQQNL